MMLKIVKSTALKTCMFMLLQVVIYTLVSLLCVVMFISIFIFPSAFRSGIPSLADAHREKIIEILQKVPIKVPFKVLLKYYQQIDIISLHIIPGGIWTILAPIQLFYPIKK